MPSNLRLDLMQLRLPVCDRFARPTSATDVSCCVQRAAVGEHLSRPLELPLPLFWFDPPWHRTSVERCRDVSRAMAEVGVVVSALHRDLSQQDDCDASAFSPRMAPHRCDRAGWIHRDFENAAIIDLRMTPIRDSQGRFAYEPNQLRRWKNRDESSSDDPEGSVNALLFPPDWASLDDMARKVAQLRRLSDAAVFVSFDAIHLAAYTAASVAAGIDGIIVRTTGDPLAAIIAARKCIDDCASPRAPALWLVSERSLSAEDCVKCFAVGADAVSVDHLCNDFLLDTDRTRSLADRAAYGLGFRPSSNDYDHIRQNASELIRPFVEQIRGYANSCGVECLADLTPEHLQPSPSFV